MNNVILLPTKDYYEQMSPIEHDAVAGVSLMGLRLDFLNFLDGSLSIERHALTKGITECEAVEVLQAGQMINEAMIDQTTLREA